MQFNTENAGYQLSDTLQSFNYFEIFFKALGSTGWQTFQLDAAPRAEIAVLSASLAAIFSILFVFFIVFPPSQ